MKNKRLILVTGASGYIARMLIPRLIESGYQVRCMVRDADKIAYHSWIGEVDVVVTDVANSVSLELAFEQVDTAYYLIHNMASGQGYQEIELKSARKFARAAAQAGVSHIIYLGGLADPDDKIASHLRSRIDTGHVLREYPVPVTEFRAGVIVGPGSISFEMIRYLCEQFPILIGPTWLKNHTQPIYSDNVIDYLVASLEHPEGQGQIFEIGGDEIHTYGEIMTIYGHQRQLKRRMLTLPALPTALMAYVVQSLTPVKSEIAHPLIEGLKSDSIVKKTLAREIFPEIRPIGYLQAVINSLSKLHPSHLDHKWMVSDHLNISIKSEGFLIFSLQTEIAQAPENLYPHLLRWCQTNLKSHQIEEQQESSRLLVKAENEINGKRWTEWQLVSQSGSKTILRQTGFFAPRGLRGFLSSRKWQIDQRQCFQKIINSFPDPSENSTRVQSTC